MDNIKTKIVTWLTSKFGVILTPIISGMVGTAVGMFYAWLITFLGKWPAIYQFFNDVWLTLDDNTKTSLDPTVIGTAAGVIIYAVIQELLNRYFLKEVKKDQEEINKVLPPEEPKLVVDGVPGPKTQIVKKKIHAAAEVAIRNMNKR